MRHLRVALYDMKSGTAEEVVDIARNDLRPKLEEQAGFVRYEVGILDSGGIVSFSVWETADEAQHALELIDSWVRDHVADRVSFVAEHTGNISWDDAP